MDIDAIKSVYFVGAGGIGMSALARFFLHEGRKVAGYDRTRTPLCEECMRQGKETPATMVDHITPIRQGGRALDMENLQSLCWSCHSAKSVKEGSRYGKR